MLGRASGGRIWIVGGTSESRAIARLLSARRIPWTATVVAPRALRLYGELPGRALARVLTAATLPRWLAEENVAAIVDASHPFATEISRLAIATGLPYLRYERPPVPLEPPAREFPTWEALLASVKPDGRRILLATGAKALPRFRPWQRRATLWARVLPVPESRQAAIAAGFPPKRILAQMPPASPAAECRLWRELGLDAVATKASGEAGGLAVKLAAARETGAALWVVARPAIAYPQQTAELSAVADFCAAPDRALSDRQAFPKPASREEPGPADGSGSN